jgi:hypothetical protein
MSLGAGAPNAPSRVGEPLIIVEMVTMQYNLGDRFRFDLTEEQKRLCDWVAQQARAGVEPPTRLSAFGVPVRQIRYQEATAALDLHEEQLTRMLRGMRERLDEIHEMVEAPIVHTQAPYFEVPVHARSIWDNYRRAEKEGGGEALGESRRPELVQR